MQPLAFSKELLPLGGRETDGTERPKAVSEYLVERMIQGGARKICIVISSGKSDILEYFGSAVDAAQFCYVVQPQPQGLCDAIFRALPVINPDEQVLVGLPDTVWFPADGFRHLPNDALSFLLFPVEHPELFDVVVTGADERVLEIQVKSERASSHWIWGAFKATGAILRQLHELWLERGRRDEYVGTLVNAHLACGGLALGIRAGTSYVDVGTLHGYRDAINLLGRGQSH